MKYQASRMVAHIALAALISVSVFSILGIATSRTVRAARNDTVVHYVINGPWFLHPGNPTDTPSISSPTSDLMQTGTEFDVQCVAAGSAITPDGNLATDGTGDNAWEYGIDAATGNSGFISDQGLDTQVTQGQEIAQLVAQGVPICGSSVTMAQTYASPHLPCAPILLIGARGSGDDYKKDADGVYGFASPISLVAEGLISYYGSDNITTYGLPYQAIGANIDTAVYDNSQYISSVNDGVNELTQTISTQVAACPNQVIDIVGYSQGADVVNTAISILTQDIQEHIGGVATFGDPLFNGQNLEDRGNYNHGYNGALALDATPRAELPLYMISKAHSYCDASDWICNASPQSSIAKSKGHFEYATTYVPDATGFLESMFQTDSLPIA